MHGSCAAHAKQLLGRRDREYTNQYTECSVLALVRCTISYGATSAGHAIAPDADAPERLIAPSRAKTLSVPVLVPVSTISQIFVASATRAPLVAHGGDQQLAQKSQLD
jgi:hypothetical protein